MEASNVITAGAPVARFECPHCDKAYRRAEHLTRHLATHSSGRPHQCRLCRARFQRSDVLRRHERTCNGSKQRVTPVPKRACDGCTKSKRACNLAQPCSECDRRSMPCVYSAADSSLLKVFSESLTNAPSVPTPPTQYNIWDGHAALHHESLYTDHLAMLSSEQLYDFIDPDLHTFMTDELGWPMEITPSGKGTISLQFLESFTRNNGLISSFDCGTLSQRSLARATFQARLDSEASLRRQSNLFTSDSFLDEAQSPSYGNDPLAIKSHDIVSLVEEVITVKPRNSAVTLSWSKVLEAMCMEFFSPQRLRLYLALYWAIWHPNVNFMHRPTFNARYAKTVLVAAMAIMGACVSSEDSDRESAHMWLNCVEEMVFRDDDFCSDQETAPSFPSKAKLQSLQAAYIVCLFQNWEGTDTSKRRIRRFRYSTLISVARDIGIPNAKHRPYHLQPIVSFRWEDYVAREELIRVFLWIFLLDTAFVIFNNLPPRFAIKEMRQQFASNEACWQAQTSELCFRFLQQHPENTKHLLSVLCESICHEVKDVESLTPLANLGPLNLFVLTSAFHSLIFQSQQIFGYDKQLVPIRNAMENWITIWQIYSSTLSATAEHLPLGNTDLTPDNMWMRVGFLRHCPEYWLLAKLIVERISATAQAGNNDPVARSYDHKDQREAADILDKYDETSMRQVNDLISEFQKVIV